MTRREFTPAELEAAKAHVARMSKDEFLHAAIAIGLIPASKPKPRAQRTALIRIIDDGTTFAVQCGWCRWASSRPLNFYQAREVASNHNHNAHRDHCQVRNVGAQVAS